MASKPKKRGPIILVGVLIAISVFLIYRAHAGQIDSSPAPASSSPPMQPAPSPTPTPTPTPSTSSASCFTASQAASEEGQSGCVQFVGYAYTSSRGSMYLDQSTTAPYGFSAYIAAGSSFGPTLLNEYSGKTIDVSGTITNYNGEPEIEITSASQVQAAQ